MKHRVIAVNLPQFHPFKENDEWWGKGFTEWTNVTKGKPRFKGHYQPHLPTDTGFYDLRLPEARQMQADMAREVGIYGFCYYHYWFNGKQLMERPLSDMLTLGEPDFPFMLCWANENWTRAWDGGEKQILIKQDYSEADDRNHIRFLCQNYFSDRRYIRVDGKPVFIIYHSTLIPEIGKSLEVMRDEARKMGEELYLCRFESFWEMGEKYLLDGFDAAIDFQPRFNYIASRNFIKRQIEKQKRAYHIRHEGVDFYDYKMNVNHALANMDHDYKWFPCITPMWDNSCRRVGMVSSGYINNTPELYEYWLRKTLEKAKTFSVDENFVFINAWNEWAEGNHLEPDIKWGRQYLDATKRAIEGEV